jgi:hypothetical protein
LKCLTMNFSACSICFQLFLSWLRTCTSCQKTMLFSLLLWKFDSAFSYNIYAETLVLECHIPVFICILGQRFRCRRPQFEFIH